MTGIIPINPAALMGKSIVEGVGVSKRPETPKEVKEAFTEILLDKVFLTNFMTKDKGIFSAEEDNLYNFSQNMGMYEELVRREMIKKMSSEERFGFSELFANVSSLQEQ